MQVVVSEKPHRMHNMNVFVVSSSWKRRKLKKADKGLHINLTGIKICARDTRLSYICTWWQRLGYILEKPFLTPFTVLTRKCNRMIYIHGYFFTFLLNYCIFIVVFLNWLFQFLFLYSAWLINRSNFF